MSILQVMHAMLDNQGWVQDRGIAETQRHSAALHHAWHNDSCKLALAITNLSWTLKAPMPISSLALWYKNCFKCTAQCQRYQKCHEQSGHLPVCRQPAVKSMDDLAFRPHSAQWASLMVGNVLKHPTPSVSARAEKLSNMV